MDSEDKYMKSQKGDILNNKRGEILSYSISQVATLLEQEENNILYFTNIFDNLLNIKILDKEFTYTDRDIDKLEFLITLKNKGLSIKEIQKYCEELSLDNEDLIAIKENTSISVNEIIETISKSGNEQFDNLKEYLTNKINENNEVLVQRIVKLIGEEQNKQLKFFKDDVLNQTKEYINSKFDIENEINTSLYNKISIKIDDLTAEKISLEDNINLQLDKFNEMSFSRNGKLMDEIKRFRTVIEQAYYVQHDIDKHKEKTSLLARIFPVND